MTMGVSSIDSLNVRGERAKHKPCLLSEDVFPGQPSAEGDIQIG